MHSLRRFRSIGLSVVVALATLFLMQTPVGAQEEKKPDLSKIPSNVMKSLNAKFPKAYILAWEREEEGGAVLHDIEFTQEGCKFEADIREDGSILNWEQAVDAKKLPDAVRKSVDTAYPKSKAKEIMEIMTVEDGKDVLEGYEITLETADQKDIEVMVAPDGRILEEPSEKDRDSSAVADTNTVEKR